MIMKNNHNQQGYILIFTLLVVATAVVISVYIANRGASHVAFMSIAIEREKAKLLAKSGIEVAIAQLAKKPPKPEEEKGQQKGAAGEQKKEEGLESKNLLKQLLPNLNHFQTFELKENVDGIDGQIRVCIMCEEGKININQIYDFEKKQFKGEKEGAGNWKLIMQELFKSIEKSTKSKDLFAAYEKVLKKRQSAFDDPTELMTQKEFSSFADCLFYEPPMGAKTDEKEQPARPIYLTDIFTVWSSSDKIEPWLFSDSINALFGLPRAQDGEIKKRGQMVVKWLEKFKEKVNWKEDWKTILMPMYGKELRTLPKNIDSLLSNTFDPKIFSVIVWGTVGNVTQKIFAIVERKKHSQNDQLGYAVTLKKLYWL